MQEEQLWALWEVAWQAYSTLHKKGAPFTRDPLLQNPFASYFEMKGSSQKRRRQERQEGKEVEQPRYSLTPKAQPQSCCCCCCCCCCCRRHSYFVWPLLCKSRVEGSRRERQEGKEAEQPWYFLTPNDSPKVFVCCCCLCCCIALPLLCKSRVEGSLYYANRE